MEHGMKEGIYKIKSPVDGAVLTATAEGSPKNVITSEWEGSDAQKWKVKIRNEDGKKIQIIRNDTVPFRNNEVSKVNSGDGASEFVQADWSFIPISSDNSTVFRLNTSAGYLTSNGAGKRITFTEAKEGEPNQNWEFEFISEIEKQK